MRMSWRPVQRLRVVAERSRAFAARHRWSLPLSVLASVSFAQLASEMGEGEMAAFDAAVVHGVQSWRGPLDAPMLFLTRVGGGLGMAVVTAVCIVALLLARRPRQAWFMLVAAGGALLLNTFLKLFFQRARPEAAPYLISLPSSFSFPSGHAMGSMGVLASVLVVLHVVGAPRSLRLMALLVVAVAVPGVALSRIYFGVHYPSDVIGGQLAAAAWVSAVTGWFHPRLLPGEHGATTALEG